VTSKVRRAAERRGRRAESVAGLWLMAKGYRIVEKRFRCHAGEIDIIAVRGRRISFIEVKERATPDAAAWAVTPRQQARIIAAAETWLARKPPKRDFEISLDVILIAPWSWPKHTAGAFRA